MKKIFLVLLALGLISSVVKAEEPCGKKSIKYFQDRDKVELINVTDKPEKAANGAAIRGNSKVMVAGIYMFVRNGETWNTYRCADDVKRDAAKNPILNLNNCALKNDFQSGDIVKKFGNSGLKVRMTSQTRLEVQFNAAGADELDSYDVRAADEGLEVIHSEYKADKVKPWQSGHFKKSIGVCRYDGRNGISSGQTGGGKTTGTPNKPVNTNR